MFMLHSQSPFDKPCSKDLGNVIAETSGSMTVIVGKNCFRDRSPDDLPINNALLQVAKDTRDGISSRV